MEIKINKDIEESKGGNMNILKKIVMGISGYFKENYSDHLFRKVVSILVVMCFVLNIANLPAYAGKSRYEKKKQIEQMKSESSSQSVSYMGDETSGTVSYMQMLSDNIEVKDNVIYKKGKGGKLEAIGTWDGEKARIMDGEGKFRENSTYTEAVKTKQNKGKASETSVIKGEEEDESEISPEVRVNKEEEKEVKSVTIGMPKEKEEDKEKTEIAKEEKVTETEGKSEVTKEAETEVIKEEGTKKEEEEETKKSYKDSAEYKEVVTKIAQDTGLSEEEVEKVVEEQLAGVKEEDVEAAIGILRDFYSNENATIINCAVESLAVVLDMTSKGVLALQALLVEISTGVFGAGSIKNIDGKTQLMTSMNAMNEVLKMYGMEAGGYSIGVEEFLANLQEGESGIIWVNGDHYITVTKEGEGYKISDNGNETSYKDEASIISKLISSYGVEKGKDIKVLTNGKEIAAKYEEKAISKEEMKEIKGARWVTYTETIKETVSVTITVTITVMVREARTGYRTVSGVNSKGESYSYQVPYTYYVMVPHKKQIKKTEKKTQTKTVTKKKWVDDPQEKKDESKKPSAEALKKQEEANKKAEEEARARAREEARKAAEEAARKAAEEEARKMAQQIVNLQKQDDKKGTKSAEQYIKDNKLEPINDKKQEVELKGNNGKGSEEEINRIINNSSTVEEKDVVTKSEEVESGVKSIEVGGKQIELKEGTEEEIDKVLEGYVKAQYTSEKIGDSKVDYDKDKGWQVTVGEETLGKGKGVTINVGEISDDDTEIEKITQEANTALSVVNQDTGIAGATASYDNQKGWQVTVPGVGGQEATTIQVAEIGTGEEAAKNFVDGYNTAAAIADQNTGIAGSTASYDSEKGWQVTVPGIGGQEATTIPTADIGTGKDAAKNFVDGYNTAVAVADQNTGIAGTTASYDSQKGWQVTVPEVGGKEVAPISVSDIGTGSEAVKNFVDGYNKAAELTNQETGIAGATASYDGQKGWQVTVGEDVVGAGKTVTVAVGDIENTDKFIKEANTAVEVAKGIDGVSLGYDAGSKSVEVKVPGLDGQKVNDTTVKVSDIGTEEGSAKKFIDGYEAAKALAGVSGSDEPNVKSQQYNKLNGSWTVELAGAGTAVNGSTVFNVKVTDEGVDITVTDIKYANGFSAFMSNPAEANALKTEINNAFKDAKNQVGNIDGNITKTVQEIAINAAQKMMNDNKAGEPNFVGPVANVGGVNPLQSLAINNFAKNLLGLSSGKDRTIYNETKGTVTQYSADGSSVQLKFKTGEGVSGDFDYNEFKNRVQSEGFDRALDYAKCYGAVESITASDKNGKEIYTARNVGYYEGDHCMALEYDFKQDGYEDGVYFKVGSDIKNGDKKVVVESFKSQDDAKKEYSMVYSVDKGDDSSYTTDWGGNLKINVSGGSIAGLDRVMEWEDEKDDDGNLTGNSVAYAVDFTDGNKVANGKDGYASGVEQIVVDPQGNVSSTRINLSYNKEKITSSDDDSDNGDENGDEKKDNFIDKYKDVLDHTSRLKINGKDDLYDGYDHVDSGWINGDECTTTTTNVTYQGNKTVYNYDKEGNLVSGSVDYKSGTEMATVLGGSLDGDTILLSNNVSFDFTVDKTGIMSMEPQTATINGTYINRVEGKEQGRGILQNGTISVDENGQIGISGKVAIKDGDTFEVSKGTDEDQNKDEEKGGSQPDASDTKAVIEEDDTGYKVSKGTISLRGGKLVVAGEGATALDGSVLLSAFGKVNVSGDYTFKDGVWVGKDENSSYKYYDSNDAKNSANKSLQSLGIEITDDKAFAGEQKGIITSDPALMFNTLVSNRGNTGVDIKVIGDDYTIDGVSVDKGAQLNISVQEVDGEKVLALRAKNTLSATYNMPEGWTAKDKNGNPVTETEIKATFNKDEYITFASLLNKAGVASVKGSVKWGGAASVTDGQNPEEVQIPVIEDVTINVKGGDYKKYDGCSLELAGNGQSVKDVYGNTRQKTNLVGKYKVGNYDAQEYTILAGAKVSLSADGTLTVKSADVYTKDMNVSQQPESNGGGNSSGAGSNVSADSHFEGNVKENDKGEIIASGIFTNYSDATVAAVFSEASIYREGSIFTKGSSINGIEVTEGMLKIKKINNDDNNHTIDFVGVNGTARYTNALGEEYKVDTSGNEEYIVKEEDVVTASGQTVLYDDNGNIVGVADKTVSADDKGYDDAKIYKDKNGDKVYVSKDDVLKIGELTDAEGNGVKKFVGVKEGNIGNSEKAGWSPNDDIFMIIDGKKVAVDTDGGLFRSGFDSSLKVKVSSPNINNGEEIEISVKDWNQNKDPKNTKTVMYEGHLIYVNKDALNIKNEHYDIDLGDGRIAEVNINYRTETVDTHDGGSYESKKETITYKVDGKEYTYDGSATGFWGGTKTEFELTRNGDENDYIKFELTGNDIKAENVLVASRWGFGWKGDQVSVSNFTYHVSADGSGYQTVYNDFIGEYDGSKNSDGTYNLKNITSSGKDKQHQSSSVTTTWDKSSDDGKQRRITSIDNMDYTWTGSYDDVGRATTIDVKDTSYMETYSFKTDDIGEKGTCVSRVEYSGTMKDVKYDKNQIESFVPVNYKETTIEYNGVDENTGKRIEVSRKTEVKTSYTEEDKQQVRKYLEADGMSSSEIDEILNKDSRISYQYVDGVKYDKEVSNIKVTTYGSINGEPEELLSTDYINSKKQNTVSTTTIDENSSGSYKTITTTLSKQDVITAYNNRDDEKADSVVRSKLETSQVNSTLYDSQNRVIYETQKGGIFKTTVIDGGNTERQKGDVLSYGKTDKVTSYTYHDDPEKENYGETEINTVSYDYDYLDRSNEYEGAENGVVTVSVTNTKGKVLLETTTESKTYVLNEGTKDKNDKENISTRTANYDVDPVEHTYSYSQSISLGVLHISPDSSRKEILETIDKLGDDKLKDAVVKMTDEQLGRLVTSDSYTIYGINVDFKEKTVSVDENVSTKIQYDARGNIVSSIKDGGETGGTFTYNLSDKGEEQFGTGTDFSSLSGLTFTASGIFTGKNKVDTTGTNLIEQSKNINNAIYNDRMNGTDGILGGQISYTKFRQDYGYERDDLGRVTSSKYVENVNGQWLAGDTKTTYSTEKGSTLATSVTSYARVVTDENGDIARNKDGSIKLDSIVTDESTRQVRDPQTGVYTYGNVGHSAPIDISMKGVDNYNALGEMRDAQRLTKDEARNTVVTAIVTAVYVAASVALAIVTFGSSALIQLTATAAITAAMALAAIPAVYSSMKKGMEAVSVGDTKTAVMEFAFVALDFAVVIGGFVKIGIALAETGKELSGLLGFAQKVGSKAIAVSEAMSKSKVGKVLKFLSPKTTVSQQAKMLSGIKEGSKISKVFGTIAKLGNTSWGKAIDLVASIGRNSLIFGINMDIKVPIWNKTLFSMHKDGLLGFVLKSFGAEDIVNSDIYKAATTLITFSPIFNEEFSRAKDGAKGGVDKSFKESIKDSKSLGELYKEAINGFKVNTLGNASTFPRAILNFVSNSVVGSAGMIADITKFNFIVTNGILGGIKTVVYNATGVELGNTGNVVLDFLFGGSQVYSSGGNFLEQSMTSSAAMMTNSSMWAFSFLTPVFTTTLTPILQKLPGIGHLIRAFNYASDSVSNQYMSTFLEENVKEELLGHIWDWVPSPELKEVLQECFDDTPDIDVNIQNLNSSYRQINQTSMQTLASESSTQQQREAAATILAAAMITRDSGVDDVKAARQATAQAILNASSSRSGFATSLQNLGTNLKSSPKVLRAVFNLGGLGNVCQRVGTSVQERSSSRNVRNAATQQYNQYLGTNVNSGTIKDIDKSLSVADIVTKNQGVQDVSENVAVARNSMAATMGLTDAYQNLVDTLLSEGASLEVALATAMSMQTYTQQTGSEISEEQQQSIRDAVELRVGTMNFGVLIDNIVNGKIAVMQMEANQEIQTDGSIDLKKMTNQQLSDYLRALSVELQYYSSSTKLTELAELQDKFDAASEELAETKKYIPSVRAFIKQVDKDVKAENESAQQAISELENYKNEEGLSLREKGLRETFVNNYIENLRKEYVIETDTETDTDTVITTGNEEITDIVKEFKDELSKEGADVDSLLDIYSMKAADILQQQMLDAIDRAIDKSNISTIKDSDGNRRYSDANKAKELFRELAEQYRELKKQGVSDDDPNLKAVTEKIGYYEKDFGVPYAPIAAIAGFREGQKAAFKDIFRATIIDGVSPDINGYVEQLQTAGGKSLIGAYTVQLLLSNPNVKMDGKMITWLTNEDGNAADLQKHAEFIFGNSLGKVLTLDQSKIDGYQDGELRKAFEECSLAIMTYGTWSSLFSSSMAALLAYDSNAEQEVKDIVDYNRKLLADKGIKLDITTKRGTTKVQFKDASQTREAIKILLESGKGTEKTDIPLEKISQMVGDEFDYSFTIPASALASASGYYSSRIQWIDYYEAIRDGKDVSVEKYAHLGITEGQIKTDRDMNKERLSEIISFYESLSDRVNTESDKGSKKIGRDQIDTIISEYSSVANTFGISKEKLTEIVSDQIESLRMKSVYSKLTDESKAFGQYNIQELAKLREEDKGGYGIDQSKVVETSEIEDSEAQKIQSGSVSVAEVVSGVVNDIVSEETKEEKKADVIENRLTPKQLEAEISKMADSIMSQYSDIFTDKSEVVEMIMTGLSAYEMFALKDKGLGTGGYKVNNRQITENGETKIVADSITITNTGKPVDNLNMPGMWVLETLEGCDAISKPSVETFISSKEAIAAFEWSIGFSGTFSTAVKGIISDLRFDNGGTAASAIRVGVTTALVRDQKNILNTITDTRDSLAKDGVASVDLIVTPNFDITTKFVDDLREKGVDMSQVVSLSLDSLDEQIRIIYAESSEQGGKYREDVLKAINMQEGEDIETVLSSRSEQEKLASMTELLKLKVKAGLASYIIGDVDLLGRGWNVGDMKNAIDGIKEISSRTKFVSDLRSRGQDISTLSSNEQIKIIYEELSGQDDFKDKKEDIAKALVKIIYESKKDDFNDKNIEEDVAKEEIAKAIGLEGREDIDIESILSYVDKQIDEKEQTKEAIITELLKVLEIKQEKVQATLWAVNFEQMDGTQYEQLLGRIDHRGGKSRFSEDYYHRDIVQITSVESARENKVLREAVNKTKDKLYSTDIILKNLPKIQLENEEEKLAKAGNAPATTTKNGSKQQETLTYEQAKSSLADKLGSDEQAQKIIDALNKSKVSESETMSESVYKKYENYVNYVAAAQSFGIEDLCLSDQELEKVVAGKPVDVLKVLKQKKNNTNEFDGLISEIKWFDENFEKEQQKSNDVYQNMTSKQQEALSRIQDASKQGKKPSMLDVLSTLKLSRANKTLQKHMKAFDSYNDRLFRSAISSGNIGYFGLSLDQTTGKVAFNNSTSAGAKVVSEVANIAQQEGNKKLSKAIKKLTVNDVEKIVDAKNPVQQLLSTINYLGYESEIEKKSNEIAVQNLTTTQQEGQETDESENMFRQLIAQSQAKQDVLTSIGTDDQKVNIPADDAKVIRAILDINIDDKSQRGSNEETVSTENVREVVKDNIIDITARVNEARKAKGVAKAEDSQDVSSDQVQEMLLESCAVEAMKGITKVVPMIRLVDGLTKMAIEMATGESEYEGLDSLKAAGEKETASIGIIKDITEYEYATVKDIEAITSPVIAYFDKNHVAKVSSKAEIEAVEKQGYKFTGLVLADKKDIASNEGLGEDILLNRVYGVMKASEVSGIVEYLTAVFKKGNREEEMKKYIGISGDITGEEGRIKINEAVINEIEKVTREGAERKVPKFIVEAQIKALTGIREMLMVASYKSSEEPGWLDSEGTSEEDIVKEIDARRTVNQSVITQSVSSGKINTDFVINVVKLQEAVTEKGLSKKMAEIQKLINSGKPDLGAIMDIQGKEDLRMPMDLFRMSDVHAVAASA